MRSTTAVFTAAGTSENVETLKSCWVGRVISSESAFSKKTSGVLGGVGAASFARSRICSRLWGFGYINSSSPFGGVLGGTIIC